MKSSCSLGEMRREECSDNLSDRGAFRMDKKRTNLMIPGPVAVDERVLASMDKPIVAHYGKDWAEFYNETVDMAKQVYQTRSDLFIMPGSGHYGVEASLNSLVEPGGELIVAETGHFGHRMTELAQSHGINTHVIDAGYGGVIQPDQIERALRAHPLAKVVAIVQNETSTGLTNPIHEVSQVCSAQGAILMVDGVSSVGGMDLKVDDWGIDVCVSASQKCLEAPPGLVLVSVSQKAVDHMRARKTPIPGWAMNLLKWKEVADKGKSFQPYYVSMAVSNVFALHTALKLILEEGLSSRFARHKKIADTFRRGVQALGLEPYGDDRYASPTIGVFNVPEGYQDKDIVSFFHEAHGMQIAGGLGELAGKTVRIGHMGPGARLEKIVPVLDALQDWLENEDLLGERSHGMSVMG